MSNEMLERFYHVLFFILAVCYLVKMRIGFDELLKNVRSIDRSLKKGEKKDEN